MKNIVRWSKVWPDDLELDRMIEQGFVRMELGRIRVQSSWVGYAWKTREHDEDTRVRIWKMILFNHVGCLHPIDSRRWGKLESWTGVDWKASSDSAPHRLRKILTLDALLRTPHKLKTMRHIKAILWLIDQAWVERGRNNRKMILDGRIKYIIGRLPSRYRCRITTVSCNWIEPVRSVDVDACRPSR